MKRKDREKMMLVFKIVAIVICAAMILGIINIGLGMGG